MKTLVPAYGRDYTNGKLAKLDYLANKDFILRDFSSRWDGKLVNAEQLQGEQVLLRFNRLTRTTVVTA